MRGRWLVPLALTAALFGSAACADDGYVRAEPASAAPGAVDPALAPSAVPADSAASVGSAPVVPIDPAAVPASLKFTGKTLDGKAFDGSSLAGKPSLLWFWAPWCATCAGQAATVSNLKDKYGTKVNVLGVAGLGDVPAMNEFVTDLDVANVTHLSDGSGVVWKRFGIVEQSLYVLIDPTGKVVHKGFLDSQQITQRVAALAG